jgi:DNA gyrase subunit A
VPCRVILSATGRIARIDAAEGATSVQLTPPARRAKHDAVRSEIATTSRSEIGAVTSKGRLVRFSPLELPVLPANSVHLAAGVKVAEYLALTDRDERVVAVVSLDSSRPIVLGTEQGIVKRVAPGNYPNRPDFEVIALKPGDRVIGAAQGGDDDELVFVTSDAQLLHFPASVVRPQGCPAGGMAGIKLTAGARVIDFEALARADVEGAVVVTLAAASDTLLGADPGAAKVSDFAEYPGKGRATGGVRAHRFLKGQDALALAWVGPGPAHALASDGTVRALPEGGAKRDGSGQPLEAVVQVVGRGIR